LQHSKFNIAYTLHNTCNALLLVCPHSYAIAFTLKQTFDQCTFS